MYVGVEIYVVCVYGRVYVHIIDCVCVGVEVCVWVCVNK